MGQVTLPPERTLRGLLRRGQGARAIGERYGVDRKVVSAHLIALDLDSPPLGELYVADAAREVGLTLTHTYKSLRDAGIKTRSWGGRRTVSEVAFQTFQAGRPQTERVKVAPEGCYTAAQVAQMRGVDVLSLRARICRAKIVPVAHTLSHKRVTALYTLRQLEHLLPTPSKPRTMPAGYLTRAQVARIVGRSPSTVTLWGRRGAPHLTLLTHSSPHAFHPLHLAAWLEANHRDDRGRVATARLRRYEARKRGGRVQLGRAA